MTVWHSPRKQPPRARKTPTTSPRLSLAVGRGLGGGRAGVCCSFRVVCKDADGNKRTLGGDAVSATLDYANGYPSLDAYVLDNTDGTYTVSYTPLHASAHCTLQVRVREMGVHGRRKGRGGRRRRRKRMTRRQRLWWRKLVCMASMPRARSARKE
jgi:hypothetical protein